MVLPRHSKKNPASSAGFFYTCNNPKFIQIPEYSQIVENAEPVEAGLAKAPAWALQGLRPPSMLIQEKRVIVYDHREQACSYSPPTELPVTALTAREVYQSLRDAALGIRPLQRLGEQSGPGLMQVDIEGWRLTLDVDGNHLRHCQRCQSPDGREGVFDSWQRTDPVSLLSTWELAQIERLLAELKTAV